MGIYSLFSPLIHQLPPETAHNAALFLLRRNLVLGHTPVSHTALQSECFGLTFKNPVGLAAGFDKNAVAVDALFRQGFGFVEAGTVTPLPQPGNPRPRMFRLKEDEAVVNWLGFNNEGVHAFASNLKSRRQSGIVGANIGKNKDSLDAMYDYTASLEAVYGLADYITVNISSPNTVGLRELQQKKLLSELMKKVARKRDELAAASGLHKPLLYKIAPDLNFADRADIVDAALEYAVDGLIISNTTITRPDGLISRNRTERGGLSGRPLFALSTEVLSDLYRLSQGRIPLIGVGGIASAEDAYAKIRAGASLVQVYTAFVYQGFGLVNRINEGLIRLLERDGFKHIKEAVGTGNH